MFLFYEVFVLAVGYCDDRYELLFNSRTPLDDRHCAACLGSATQAATQAATHNDNFGCEFAPISGGWDWGIKRHTRNAMSRMD